MNANAPVSSRRNLLPVVASGLWLLTVGSAMALLAGYAETPGNASAPPRQWPADSRIAPDPARPTLVLVAHPHCPCTRATLGELERLMARGQGKLDAHVVFIRPAGTDEEWVNTDLWRTAAAIPGVSVHRDDAGVEARRFHAGTSGQTLLYGRDGSRRFHGGITLSRGHAGDNPGSDAVLASLDRAPAGDLETPVFGCPLFAAKCSREGDATCKQ